MSIACGGPYRRRRFEENDMTRKALVMVALAGILAGCENMSPGQKGAATGGALGAGIGMVAGGSVGQVGGAGRVGGSASRQA